MSMTTSTNVDLLVVGTGSAAGAVAYKCRSAGWTVTVIDSRPFGGTCQLRGCDPKKVLVGGAELVDWDRRMQSNGVPAPGLTIDWPDLMRFKRTFTDPVPEQNERSFASAGIGMLHGRARFVDRTTLRVDDQTITGRYVVIAGGARRATLNIPGEEHLTTSTQFLEPDRLPGQIVFVGGGYIAFEFAHTTAIALEPGRGKFALAIALGIVLLLFALIVNAALGVASGAPRPESDSLGKNQRGA